MSPGWPSPREAQNVFVGHCAFVLMLKMDEVRIRRAIIDQNGLATYQWNADDLRVPGAIQFGEPNSGNE